MSDDESRYQRTYVTGSEEFAIYVDAPVGFVMPPTLLLHKPGAGSVVFYDAECFGLRDLSGDFRPSVPPKGE